MPLLLICILTLSVFWEGGCQPGDEPIPQFTFTDIDSTAISDSPPDSDVSTILRNQTENIASGSPLSITKTVSREDSGTSTPPTTATPSITPSLEGVKPQITTSTGPALTPAQSDTHGMLSTDVTSTTILSKAVTNRKGSLTTAATNTTAMLTTVATYTNATVTTTVNMNVTSTTAANGVTTAALTTAATNASPALALAADMTNGNTPATQIPFTASAGTSPNALDSSESLNYSDEEYEDRYEEEEEEEEEEAEKSRRGDMPKCWYDPCAHLQPPCAEVSRGGCLCPGLTPDSAAPGPPLSLDARDVTADSAEVRWCAPYSSVSEYELLVQEEAGGALTRHALGPAFRSFRLTALRERREYSVCVVAKNRAGSSSPLCTALVTSWGVPVGTYALGAAVAGLALLALVLAACLCHHCRKPPLENQRNTSLISIPNPAYCHPQDRADILKV